VSGREGCAVSTLTGIGIADDETGAQEGDGGDSDDCDWLSFLLLVSGGRMVGILVHDIARGGEDGGGQREGVCDAIEREQGGGFAASLFLGRAPARMERCGVTQERQSCESVGGRSVDCAAAAGGRGVGVRGSGGRSGRGGGMWVRKEYGRAWGG
jgi:hypothetical protein